MNTITYVNALEDAVDCECMDYDWQLPNQAEPIMTLRVFSANRPENTAPMVLIVRGERGWQVPFHMSQIRMLAKLLENEEFLNDVESL